VQLGRQAAVPIRSRLVPFPLRFLAPWDMGGKLTSVMTQPDSRPLQPRRSACAERSREAEVVRIGQMTVEERIKAALRMGQRFSWLKPAPVSPRNG
jgi:hypothetical protein